MENNNKEQHTIASEKKTWAIPELIVIDKKVVEGGFVPNCFESGGSDYCSGS